MAVITPTRFEIVRRSDLGQEEVLTNAHVAGDGVAGRQGKVFYVNGTTGRAVLAGAATLAAHGRVNDVTGAIVGIASTPSRGNLAQTAVTLLRDADVFLGVGVLDALPFGAPVFLSNSGGTLESDPEVPTIVVQIGHVVPSIRKELGNDKLLRIRTEYLADMPVAPSGGGG